MQGPLNRTRRRVYFLLFAGLFIVLIPIVTLLADGYRLDKNWKLVATGGISLSYVPPDAQIFFNYSAERSSTFFHNTFFVQNLVPDTYLVVVAKQGYWSWAKHLQVNPKEVTSADILIVPQKPNLVPIQPLVPSESSTNSFHFFNGTTSAEIANPEYDTVQALFATGTSPLPEKFPFAAPASVKRETFFPYRTDALLVLTTDGLYAVEIDTRPPQNIEPIYLTKNIDFRVGDNGSVYIRENGRFYQVGL